MNEISCDFYKRSIFIICLYIDATTNSLSSFNYVSMHHENIAYSTYLIRAGHHESEPHDVGKSLVCSLPKTERSHKTLCLWRGRTIARHRREPQSIVFSSKLENNGFLRE